MYKEKAHILEDRWRSDDVRQQEVSDFDSLLLDEKILRGLKKAGFKKPSPIQLESIPVGRFGSDLIVQAKSGTGKTLVFAIIALDRILPMKQPQVLILTPTREIAFQICSVINSIGSEFEYLKCAAFIGGLSLEEDRRNIVDCQIVVGTPGRIKQLLTIHILNPNSIRILVLDEADQLCETSFQFEIDSIFSCLQKDKQVIITSATYPKSLRKLEGRYFRGTPFIARLNVKQLALLGTLNYIKIVEVNPMPVLAHRAKMRALEEVLTSVEFAQCLVFCNGTLKVEAVCEAIKDWGFSCSYTSSARDQAARLKAIECLKRFKCKVFVTSDLSSRGIDAENVDLIVSIDLPSNTETYLHRAGRAGRYGSKGVAVTFISSVEMDSFKRMQLEGNFKSYFLPDPIPRDLKDEKLDPKAELLKDEDIRMIFETKGKKEEPSSESKTAINPNEHVSKSSKKSTTNNQKPDPKAELLKDEESVSERSNGEPSSLDNMPPKSRTTINPVEHVLNGRRNSATINQKPDPKVEYEEISPEEFRCIKYSKKQGQGAFKNSNKGQVASKHFSDTESTSSSSDTESTSSSSDTESSSDSEDLTELKLFKRAHRKMVETSGESETIGEKTDVPRSVLYGVKNKIPSGKKSKQSLSDIQITTATHSSKVNKSSLNEGKLLHGNKTRKLDSMEALANAKKFTNSGCSSSKFYGKNVNGSHYKSSSGAANCAENSKREKAATNITHSRANDTRAQFYQKSFACAAQVNFNVYHPQNSRQVSNCCFNCQGDYESGAHTTPQYGHHPQNSWQVSNCCFNCHGDYGSGAHTTNQYDHHPQKSRQVSNCCFNCHCDFERGVHPTHHHHDISCCMPSQHRCHL